METTGLYVHIPFCRQKCHYCDFPSYPLGHLASDYLKALMREAEQVKQLKVNVGTVFVGGGTPTCLTAEELERLLAFLRRSFFITSDAEFTMEANPGTVTAEKLRILKKYGVNRLSFGVQAFQPELLRRLGRMHTVEDIYTGFALSREQGFRNINIDLMSGLPGQTLGQWEETLGKAVALGPEHIAAYGLKVEEGTPFHQQMSEGKLALPDEDTDASMVEIARDMLQSAGFQQYEISNFAKPGYQSQHNLRYWCNETYIGIGCAAWSYWDGVRRGNIRDVKEYMARIFAGKQVEAEGESVNRQQSIFETMMLGLRLIDGVNRRKFAARYGVDPLEVYAESLRKMEGSGLLAIDEDRIYLTKQGLLLGNIVFGELLS
jgi:oxygen-independent coproporphyrinogen-3 oxidase